MSHLIALHEKAMAAAKAAAAKNEELGPESARGFDCGFAWVKAPTVKMNTKEGKALKALGFEKIWSPEKGAYLWNPGKVPTQSISVHYAGAVAYCEAMKESGIQMIACQRYD